MNRRLTPAEKRRLERFQETAADLQALCRKMQQHFDPFEARISRIELSQVREDGYTIRDVIRLR